jgi:hypothetical protein
MCILCAFHVFFMYFACVFAQAEQAEVIGPLDAVSEFASERIQQKLGFLFKDKGHPAPNFWTNYRILTSAYTVPEATIRTVLQSLDTRGFADVADAIRTVMPPIPLHVTINESMDRALRSATLQPTPLLDDVLLLLKAACAPLAALWSEFALLRDDQRASTFVTWAREMLNDRPADSMLVQSITRAGAHLGRN